MNQQVFYASGNIAYRIIGHFKGSRMGRFEKGIKELFLFKRDTILIFIRYLNDDTMNFIEMASERCLISSSIGKTIIGYFG